MKSLLLLAVASMALAACVTTEIAPVAEGDGLEQAADLRGALPIVEAPPPPVEPQRQVRRGRERPPLTNPSRGEHRCAPTSDAETALTPRARPSLTCPARSTSFTPTPITSRPFCSNPAKH
jgi:hypothetical protein